MRKIYLRIGQRLRVNMINKVYLKWRKYMMNIINQNPNLAKEIKTDSKNYSLNVIQMLILIIAQYLLQECLLKKVMK